MPVLAKLPLSRLLVVHKIPTDNSPKCHRMLETRKSDLGDNLYPSNGVHVEERHIGDIYIVYVFLDVPGRLDQPD
jgi:hypothetical protein